MRHGHTLMVDGRVTVTPIYKAWMNMRRRCGPNHDRARNYYARGIVVCERWQKFENFLADMAPRPDGTWLERVDNDSGYGPENCRWATPAEQAHNKRTNKIDEHVAYAIWIGRAAGFGPAGIAAIFFISDNIVRHVLSGRQWRLSFISRDLLV